MSSNYKTCLECDQQLTGRIDKNSVMILAGIHITIEQIK